MLLWLQDWFDNDRSKEVCFGVICGALGAFIRARDEKEDRRGMLWPFVSRMIAGSSFAGLVAYGTHDRGWPDLMRCVIYIALGIGTAEIGLMFVVFVKNFFRVNVGAGFTKEDKKENSDERESDS